MAGACCSTSKYMHEVIDFYNDFYKVHRYVIVSMGIDLSGIKRELVGFFIKSNIEQLFKIMNPQLG